MPPKKSSKKRKISIPREESIGPEAQPADTTLEIEDVPSASSTSPPRKNKRGAPRTSPEVKAGGSKKSSRNTSQVEGGSLPVLDLLSLLCSGVSVDAIVNDFMALSQSSPKAAVSAVVNMICRACGAPADQADVVCEDINDLSAINATLEEVFARINNVEAYALISKDAKYKGFKKACSSFFEKFIIESFQKNLQNGQLMELLAHWLTNMGESKARSFRHTASLAMFSIVQGLTACIDSLQTAIAAQNRKKPNPAAEKKLLEILQLQSDFFSYSIHARAKDVAPEIRLQAFQSLSHWVIVYPQQFLQNKYLRYYSIALYDKNKEVRLVVLETLVFVLAKLSAFLDQLREFLRHFAERIVEMAADVDAKCAAAAVEIAALILKVDAAEAGSNGPAERYTKTLTNDMVDSVLMSVMDDRSVLRNSAGVLLKIFIGTQTAGTDESRLKTIQARTLISFATILRQDFGESIPERYLVDALWDPRQAPPSLLTEFQPFLQEIKSNASPNCSVALEIIAAVMLKLNDSLTVGPAPKDEMRVTGKAKLSKRGVEELDALPGRISHDLADILPDVLTKTAGDEDVLVSICHALSVMDLHAFNSQRLTKRFLDCLDALKNAVLSATKPQTLKVLADMWRRLAFTTYPQKAAAEGKLHEVMKQVLKQIAQLEKEKKGSSRKNSQNNDFDEDHLLRQQLVWSRLGMISSLVALPSQWGLFTATLLQHTLARSSPLMLAPIVECCYNGILWQTGASQTDPTVDAASIGAQIAEVADHFLQIARTDSGFHEDLLSIRVQTLCKLADLFSFPYYTLQQSQQQEFLEAVSEIGELCAEKVRQATDRMKEALRLSVTGAFAMATAAITTSRKLLSQWESNMVRIVTGTSRLFTLSRLSESLAPKALLLWTKSNVKPAADIWKNLFHTLRDRAADPAQFERNILIAGVHAVNVNPATQEELYQIGNKLAMIHFLPTDKFASCLAENVKWSVEYAKTTDPVVLLASAPLCTRLRQSEALHLANELERGTELAHPEWSSNPYVRQFISALRRAAKLEENRAPSGAAVSHWATTPSASGTTVKRSANRPVVQEDDALLADIVNSKKKSMGRGAKSTKDTNAAAGKQVAVDGWRTRPGGASAPQVAPVGTQESYLSSKLPPELEDETFIATEEWE